LSTLEVHLDAVARNWLYFKKSLKSGADCAAVVKADAYGLGAAVVAPALFDQGCRHFFVAHADEGFAVRKVVPSRDAVIYVLNGPYGASAAEMMTAGLVPVLNTPGDIAYWAEVGAPGDARRPALLHIDTGMNRFGLSVTEAQNLDRDLLRKVDIRYVMSHLACADETAHPMNRAQLTLFSQTVAVLGMPFRLSFANSAGILLGADYHFDLVRPGCGLYGINPSSDRPNPMQGAVTLSARVVQVREIDRPGTVGYGASYAISPPAKCATVSVGYADGYLRSFTGCGRVFIGGEACSVIGRVSMDSIIVDISHVAKPVTAGMMAEIIGKHQSIDDVAAQAGTIGYEILTSLGKRYKRIYTNG